MNGLFDKDPAFTERVRDRKGRFATKERALLDKTREESNRYRLQVERYRRLAEEPTKGFIAQQRIIAQQNKRIDELRKELEIARRIIKQLS